MLTPLIPVTLELVFSYEESNLSQAEASGQKRKPLLSASYL